MKTFLRRFAPTALATIAAAFTTISGGNFQQSLAPRAAQAAPDTECFGEMSCYKLTFYYKGLEPYTSTLRLYNDERARNEVKNLCVENPSLIKVKVSGDINMIKCSDYR